MKILIAITHGKIGGATNVVYELAKELHRRGIKVTVGMSGGEYLAEKLAAAGIPMHRFDHLERSHNPFAMVSFVNEVRRYVARESFDAVIFNSSNTLPGALGAKLASKKVRTIFTVHGLSMLSENYRASPSLKWAYRQFFKFFLHFIDVPVFVSENDLREARRIGLTRNGAMIHNGIAPSSLHFIPRDEARRKISAMVGRDLEHDFVIGSIGRLSYEKNYDFVIRAFPKIVEENHDARLVLIGDGPEREKYRALITALHLEENVFLAGETTDASQYLKAFDLFVLPSRYEGLPMTLIECTFAGIPIVAADVGGIKEIAPPASRYPFNDEEKFLRALEHAFEDPHAFIPGKETSEHFTAEAMAGRYLALLES